MNHKTKASFHYLEWVQIKLAVDSKIKQGKGRNVFGKLLI